ncbi:hypothetical protein PIB30_082948, partial [Stylosanthes scabra]|nr:hypothetical protein [Stylosanthes scabra]
SGSDGYYSCEDSLPSHQLDMVEPQHRNCIDEFFRALMQERAEIKEAQKKAEIRLQTMTKLATHVIEHFNNPQLPHPQPEGLREHVLSLCDLGRS